MAAKPDERKQALFVLLNNFDLISQSQVLLWLTKLLQVDLQLTEHDIESIQWLTSLRPAALQEIIAAQLSPLQKEQLAKKAHRELLENLFIKAAPSLNEAVRILDVISISASFEPLKDKLEIQRQLERVSGLCEMITHLFEPEEIRELKSAQRCLQNLMEVQRLCWETMERLLDNAALTHMIHGSQMLLGGVLWELEREGETAGVAPSHLVFLKGIHSLMRFSQFTSKKLLLKSKKDTKRRIPLRNYEFHLKVEFQTRIVFPLICALKQSVELKIQLTKEKPKETNATGKISVPFEVGTEQTTLQVHITAPSFAVTEHRKSLVVLVSGDSEEIMFELFPTKVGEQTIDIEFFHENTRVGYVIVKTQVGEKALKELPAKVVVMEDPNNVRKESKPSDSALKKRILHVNWSKDEGRLLYTIYSSDPNDIGEWAPTNPDRKRLDDIVGYLQDLNVFLNDVVTYGNPTEEVWKSIILNVQGVCEDLFRKLIPHEVAERAKKWEQGSYVIVSTNEEWIPWELLYDGQEFWGEKFILARYPRLSDRQVPDADKPESQVGQHIKKIVHVIGGGIKPVKAVQDAARLFNTLPSSIVRLLQEKTVSELQKELVDSNALHCTCHGYLKPYLLQIASMKTPGVNILPQSIRKLPLTPGSFVFVNACASTAPVLTFGNFTTFGWEFYRQGAGVFVGTLGAVPVEQAINFAEVVYQEMFRKDKKQTIGQAIAAAKKAAAKERNLFWLLYCIYGDPEFALEIA